MASMLGRLDNAPTVKDQFHTHGRIFVGDHTPKLGLDLT